MNLDRTGWALAKRPDTLKTHALVELSTGAHRAVSWMAAESTAQWRIRFVTQWILIMCPLLQTLTPTLMVGQCRRLLTAMTIKRSSHRPHWAHTRSDPVGRSEMILRHCTQSGGVLGADALVRPSNGILRWSWVRPESSSAFYRLIFPEKELLFYR